MQRGPAVGAAANQQRRNWFARQFGSRREWFARQFNQKSVARFIILLGFFGYIPGFTSVAVPLLLVYGVIKHREVAQALYHIFRSIRPFLRDSSYSVGNFIGNLIANDPYKIVKWFGIFLFWFTCSIPFIGFMGAYGLSRLSYNEWRVAFEHSADRFYRYALGLINGIARNTTFEKQMGILIGSSCMVAISIYLAHAGFIFSLGLFLFQTAACLVGCGTVLLDIVKGLINLPKTIVENYGKFHYVAVGRRLAYFLLSGHMQGAIGPAKGYIHHHGLGTNFLTYLFSPAGKFLFGSNYYDQVSQAFAASVGWLFTYQVDMIGNFSGQIGPTPFHVIAFMLGGLVTGVTVEKLIDKLLDHLVRDMNQAKNLTVADVKAVFAPWKNHINEIAPHIKWHVAFVAFATPMIMLSPSAATFIALAEGSLVGATLFTAGSLIATLALINGIRYGYQAFKTRRAARQQGAHPAPRAPAAQPAQAQPAVNPPVVPLFNAAVVQQAPAVAGQNNPQPAPGQVNLPAPPRI